MNKEVMPVGGGEGGGFIETYGEWQTRVMERGKRATISACAVYRRGGKHLLAIVKG